ncbi:coiled-coil domain-containing protein 189 isoform X3 [Phasianus colchicus]|uniref:coiled-coil domain-containing protein 189 isoform X3 n=1 Tax=Phasianus colchicus TaxID=9054 RepID=UPI00129D771C|nr:coiled-coil domain-containing protein 189 isoform X3 [Phasianus colchicus]
MALSVGLRMSCAHPCRGWCWPCWGSLVPGLGVGRWLLQCLCSQPCSFCPSLTAVKLGSVCDLDVVAMEQLQAAPTQQDRRVVLAEILPGPPVLLDAYEAAVELGQELELSLGPLSALLGIVRCAISMCTQTPLPDVEECYAYFSELLLCHAVHVACIAAHLFGTVLRHAKLYAYVFTPQACLDLTLVYVDSPEHGPEGEMPTTLPEEQGETTENPSTEPLLQEAAVPEVVQVPAEMHLSIKDVSVSPRASPRGKKHLRRLQGSRQRNKRP